MELLLIFILTSFFSIFSIEGRSYYGFTKQYMVSKISLPPFASPAFAPLPASPYHAPSPSPLPSPSPSPSPSFSRQIFNVMSFGAIGDGESDDTEAFTMAWDSACSHTESSSLLLVPYGYNFLILPTIFTGPCKGGLEFQIDGTIMPPDGPESWPENVNKRQWLVFYKINEMVMHGGGAIDGRGEKWWNLPCKPHNKKGNSTHYGPCDSPVAMRFFMSSNLTVKGLKVMNSPQFHFRFDYCQNIHVERLNIKAPALSPNTDGIHVENTINVHIYNSIVSNGDDCVSIGAGCHNVDIKNITCGPSHGISIGSLGIRNSRACVSNITVTDSVIKHSDNGVRIKTWQGGYGSVSKVTFNNIHMDTVRNPIIIDQYYCSNKHCNNQTSAVYISDILYSNIKGTYDVRSPALHLACSDSVPCSNLILSDIELLPAKGEYMANPFCWNAYGTAQTLTIPPVYCLQAGIPQFEDQGIVDQC